MLRSVLGWVCAGVLLAGAAQAAELSQTGPQASSASIIAARPQMKEDALEIALKISDGGKPYAMTVDLAQDFTVAYQDMHGTIYDYALNRAIALDDGAKSFSNSSLFALADFSAAETYNRRGQRAALQASKKSVPMVEPFWVQSELHVMAPEDGVPKIVRSKARDGSIHFRYGGKEVASYSLSKQKLSAADSAALARYLRMSTSLHPTIIDEIAASSLLPKTIAFAQPPEIKKPQAVWAFQSAVAVKAYYPLRAGLKLELGPTNGTGAGVQAIRDLLPVMQAAVAGQAPGKRSIDDFQASIDKALTDDKFFQAVLLALELNLQYGEQAASCAAPAPKNCHSLKDVLTAAANDPRTAAIKRALTPGKPEDAIAILQGIKHDDVSNPYVVDDLLANDLNMAGHRAEALPLFVTAIKGNPYLAGYYKDLGDLYRNQFQPDLAWLCYDLGRALPDGSNAAVISDVTASEARLAKEYPQFF